MGLGDNDTHHVVLHCISQVFGPFISDCIPAEIKGGECLCEKVKIDIKDMMK